MESIISGLVLAAGHGVRMKSKKPKALQEICHMPLIGHVLLNLSEAGISDVCVVLGHGAQEVRSYVEKNFPNASFAMQTEQLGTGDAVMSARGFLEGRQGKAFIACGDSPFIFGGVIKSFIEASEGYDLSVLTQDAEDPKGLGRIVRANGAFDSIVEEADCDEATRLIKEINTGAYLVDCAKLLSIFPDFTISSPKGEYYLTDAAKLFQNKNYHISAFKSEEKLTALSANDRVELARCESAMRSYINSALMRSGVGIHSPETATVSRDSKVGPDTEIYGACQIYGGSAIGSGNTIRGGRVFSTAIGNDNDIDESVLEGSTVGDNCQIGPYAHLRPGTRLLGENRIGNFVELKAASVGEGTKIAHLSYIGDAEVGKGANIGCGVVTANYDGKEKHKTVIGDGAFIGCNVNLVAPVEIGEGAFVGAGSTITKNVLSGMLALERSEQTQRPYKK